MRFSARHFPLVALALWLWAQGAPAHEAPLDVLFPHEYIDNIDKVRFPEPSGIAYHPGRQTLFVVSDEGYIEEIQRDGALVKHRKIRKADFEGITCDPATGLLYVAVEGEEKIVEVDPESLEIRREFAVERKFQGRTVLDEGGQGIEGIAFVSDAAHPQGGTFYVSNQSFDLQDEEDLSALLEVEVPLKSAAGSQAKAKILRCFRQGATDLSGLHYDADRDRFYSISDANNALFEIDRSGAIRRAYAFPGNDQEGITMDPDGFVYVAQDGGGIIKLRWNREEP